ncbi:MAG: hypothetical protein H0T73_17305 [Ardenticatenales bacterium]|nr:hypothetical protein [Ardenticatenales bacterium]
MSESRIGIRVGEQGEEVILAEPLGQDLARLLDSPMSNVGALYDVVRYDPSSAQRSDQGMIYRMVEVTAPSGYRAYLTWAVHHKPQQVERWQEELEKEGIVIRPHEWVNDRVRQLIIALPPTLSALEALVRFNRTSPTVEIVCPLLGAHADDLERAKSDLERAVAWGGLDAPLTYAIAEAFEEMSRWDEAMPFWERLAHTLPSYASARERLALNYARLGVFPHAATEFDRAAHLTDDPEHRRRLEAARDLMWERSRL